MFWILCYMKGQSRHFQKSFLAELFSELGMTLNDVEATKKLIMTQTLNWFPTYIVRNST